MQTAFDKASRLLEGAIIASGEPPFGAFAPADDLKAFYARLAAQQAKQGSALLGGFVFGGAFADLAVGRPPKDFDIYIASPNMVRALTAFQTGGYADDDYMNEDEWAEMALGYGFPVQPHTGLSFIKHSPVIGEYYEFNGHALMDGVMRKVDIKIGTNNPTMEEFLRHAPAPIMAAAMALDRDNAYAYHQKCVDHAQRGILCTERADMAHFVEKARRKGLELMTPAQLESRENQVQALMNLQVAGRQPALS